MNLSQSKAARLLCTTFLCGALMACGTDELANPSAPEDGNPAEVTGGGGSPNPGTGAGAGTGTGAGTGAGTGTGGVTGSSGNTPIAGSGGAPAAVYPCDPWILAGIIPNARDLGGLTTTAGQTIGCGQIFRGSALSTITEQGCTEFATRGIRSVIDLRTPSEVAAAPDPACTVSQSKLLAAPMPTPYSVSPSDYLADLAAADSVRAAFEVLGNSAAYPVYFHCVYGRDRTGVLGALILLVLGASRETIMADYQRTREAGFSTTPGSLEAVLDKIEAEGGIEAHLASQGIPMAALAVLREKVLATP